jgi:hypothetical protein
VAQNINVADQIIINMVMNNQCIQYFDYQDICNFKFFGLSYRYLEFVRTRYLQNGSVTLGELMSKFPDFPCYDLSDVSKDCSFLTYQIKEAYVYNELARMIDEGMQKYSNDGIQLMGLIENKVNELRAIIPTHVDYDVIKSVKDRQEKYIHTANDPNAFIPTGFAEIDQLIGGWSKNGELFSILARMGMGKTWILMYIAVAAWKAGFRVGIVSVEMGKEDIGFRIDTLLSGLSNSALRRGDALDMQAYNSYVASLEGKEGILIRSKRDFNGHITPSKLRTWIESSHLDLLLLDGISYIENERINAAYKSDASTATDVSEDLMSISGDTHCPIGVTQQANRSGSDLTQNPNLESARGGDGVNINASFAMSIAYPDDSHQIIALEVKKSRFGRFGDRFTYAWDPDRGYIQSRNETSQGGAFYGSNSVAG